MNDVPMSRKEMMQQLGIPDHVQVWPMGHGQVIITTGLATHAGFLYMTAVPDDIEERQKQYPDSKDLLYSLMRNENGQSTIISFKDKKSVDNHIAVLQQLKEDMPDE